MEPEYIALRQFQFSMRTVFVLVVLAAALASLWLSARQHRENLRLHQENTRLRNEVGELTIEPGNENKVHAIAVPELEARTWKWRVYIPDGRPLGLQTSTKSGGGLGSTWSILSPGEHTIVVALRRDLNNHWEWVVRDAQDGGVGETRHTASPNVERLVANYSANSSGVGHATRSAQPGADLELLKFEMTGTNASESIEVTIHDGPH